mmetsp:Transcript_13908/g.10031  ORF Transcript_13908/g.10031 Transcript_13908/m.10031 type:complete len:114 (+) Transcript_13908:2802-3143(+)
MLGALLFFEEPFANIVTITYSALIVSELLNVYSTVMVVKWLMILSTFISLILYGFSFYFLRGVFQLEYMDFQFWVNITVLTLASWLPVFTIFEIQRRCFPTEAQKIRMQEKNK